MIQHTVPGNLTPTGYEQITDLSSAVALTVPSGARVALVQVDTAGARWRDDGTSPTSSVGMLLPADSEPVMFVGSLATLEFIQVSAGAALNVAYYR